jgi:hypothetical protein
MVHNTYNELSPVGPWLRPAAESRQTDFRGNRGSCLFDPHQQNFGVDVMAPAISAARDVQRRFHFRCAWTFQKTFEGL